MKILSAMRLLNADANDGKIYAITVGSSYRGFRPYDKGSYVMKRATTYVGTFEELLEIFKPRLEDGDRYQKEHPEAYKHKGASQAAKRRYMDDSVHKKVPTAKIDTNPKTIDKLVLQLKKIMKNQIYNISEMNSSIKLTTGGPADRRQRYYYEQHGAGEIK